MRDHLSSIPVFVAAVEAGGFSAAAAKLNLSRSAVGKTVARLEARLGARLFRRTTRSQSLTEDGQAFYDRCLRALDELRAGEAMLESGRREVAGRLRVSVPVLFGRRCIAPILTRLALQHPKLELDLHFSDRRVHLVEDGFDLAIRNGLLSDAAGLVARRIATHRMVVCAAPGYLRDRGTPSSLADFERHEALTYNRTDNTHACAWRFRRDDGSLIDITPPGRMRFDDLEAIADAAAAAFGLAWLPCWLVRDRVQRGELVTVSVGAIPATSEAHAVWPRTPHQPLRVRLAIDALASELQSAMDPPPRKKD